MTPSLWLAFLIASIGICIIPGPTVMMAISYGLVLGRKAAVKLALYVIAADAIAMILSLIGVGALFQYAPMLIPMLKIGGALYIIYMGYSVLRAQGTAQADVIIEQDAYRKIFWVTVTNPKSILFFISFVPQFIDAEKSYTLQAVVYLLSFLVIAFVNINAYVYFTCKAVDVWGISHAALQKTGGIVLMLVGAGILLGQVI